MRSIKLWQTTTWTQEMAALTSRGVPGALPHHCLLLALADLPSEVGFVGVGI